MSSDCDRTLFGILDRDRSLTGRKYKMAIDPAGMFVTSKGPLGRIAANRCAFRVNPIAGGGDATGFKVNARIVNHLNRFAFTERPKIGPVDFVSNPNRLVVRMVCFFASAFFHGKVASHRQLARSHHWVQKWLGRVVVIKSGEQLITDGDFDSIVDILNDNRGLSVAVIGNSERGS